MANFARLENKKRMRATSRPLLPMDYRNRDQLLGQLFDLDSALFELLPTDRYKQIRTALRKFSQGAALLSIPRRYGGFRRWRRRRHRGLCSKRRIRTRERNSTRNSETIWAVVFITTWTASNRRKPWRSSAWFAPSPISPAYLLGPFHSGEKSRNRFGPRERLISRKSSKLLSQFPSRWASIYDHGLPRKRWQPSVAQT